MTPLFLRTLSHAFHHPRYPSILKPIPAAFVILSKAKDLNRCALRHKHSVVTILVSYTFDSLFQYSLT